MAGTDAERQELINLLDYLEMLPRFFASPKDDTDTFRSYLEDIASEYPSCLYALKVFDASNMPEQW
jgi:hypothetical protein